MNNQLPYYTTQALSYQHQTQQPVYLPPVNHLINHPLHQLPSQPNYQPNYPRTHRPTPTAPPAPEEPDDDNDDDNGDEGPQQSDPDVQQDDLSEEPQPALEPVGELPTETIYPSPAIMLEAVHAWGARTGVDLVRRKAKSTKKGLPPYRWMMVCARSGKKDGRNGRGIRKRGTLKCNCPFRFHCVAVNPQNVNGEYRVTMANENAQHHNHPLAPPDSLNGAKRRMRRQEASQRQQQIKNLRRIGVADTNMREYLGEAGPPAEISNLAELIWRVD